MLCIFVIVVVQIRTRKRRVRSQVIILVRLLHARDPQKRAQCAVEALQII